MANQALVVPALAGIPTRFRLKPVLRRPFAVLPVAIGQKAVDCKRGRSNRPRRSMRRPGRSRPGVSVARGFLYLDVERRIVRIDFQRRRLCAVVLTGTMFSGSFELSSPLTVTLCLPRTQAVKGHVAGHVLEFPRGRVDDYPSGVRMLIADGGGLGPNRS